MTVRNVMAAACAVVESCESTDGGYLVDDVSMGWLADAIEDESTTRNPTRYRVVWNVRPATGGF